MTADELSAKKWYWVRRADGSLAPYVFHRIRTNESKDPAALAEFFVGSFLQAFRLSQVVAEAQVPTSLES